MLRLRLESLGAGGEAVGRGDDGRVVFVDGGAPGDLVDVELTEQKARWARGRIARLVEAGPTRVPAPCPHSDGCGGCPWQVVSDEAQRAAKQAIVARALARVPIEIAPLVAAPVSHGYRGRAMLYARGGQLGFHARRSHALQAIDRCLMLEPALDAALQRARSLDGGGLAAALGEEGALRGTVAPSGKVQLAFVRGRGGSDVMLEALAKRVVAEGVAIGVLLDGERAIGEALLDAGEPGRSFFVSAAGFRQANDAQNRVLRERVQEALRADGASVLELYAGDGNFTRDLVGRATRVVAIEEDAAAVARLRRNVPTAQAVVARVEREVQRRARAGERHDRVLLDPPRAGAKEAMASVATLGAERIVYVSCEPSTLARDLAMLPGYRAIRATPIDLMPHTDHIEVLVEIQLA